MSGVAPPTIDALRRVRRLASGTHLWTCDAERTGTRIRSEALHRMLTRRRPAADRAGARPNPRLPLPLTVILNSSDADYKRRAKICPTFDKKREAGLRQSP